MTPYLARLVDRARGSTPRVKPIVASRFAPNGGGLSEVIEERSAERAPRERAPVERAQTAADTSLPPRTSENSFESHPPEAAEREPSGDFETSRTRTDHAPNRQRDSDLVPEQFRPPGPNRIERIAAPEIPAVASQRDHDRTRSSAEPVEPAPVVRVTIGRIDVRAAPEAGSARRPTARAAGPKLTLDAYLKSREEGAR